MFFCFVLFCFVCFFLLFITRIARMGRVRASGGWLKCTHTGVTVRCFCETSLSFCFVLLLRDWYRAVVSRQRMILVSIRFSTFASLIRAISKHRIILNSSGFFTYACLIQLRLFSTSCSRKNFKLLFWPLEFEFIYFAQ